MKNSIPKGSRDCVMVSKSVVIVFVTWEGGAR
jgi:hypothetical protein